MASAGPRPRRPADRHPSSWVVPGPGLRCSTSIRSRPPNSWRRRPAGRTHSTPPDQYRQPRLIPRPPPSPLRSSAHAALRPRLPLCKSVNSREALRQAWAAGGVRPTLPLAQGRELRLLSLPSLRRGGRTCDVPKLNGPNLAQHHYHLLPVSPPGTRLAQTLSQSCCGGGVAMSYIRPTLEVTLTLNPAHPPSMKVFTVRLASFLDSLSTAALTAGVPAGRRAQTGGNQAQMGGGSFRAEQRGSALCECAKGRRHRTR